MRLITTTLLAMSALSAAAAPWKSISAQDVIRKLNLVPNVEKGYYIQTFVDPGTINNRSYSTAIYYLLEGNVGASIWHKVDTVEVWHHYVSTLHPCVDSATNSTRPEPPLHSSYLGTMAPRPK